MARAIENFFFAPASARPWGCLRIGLAAVLIWQALLVRHDVLNFFAADGFVQSGLANYLGDPDAPQLGWFAHRLQAFGIGETTCIVWATRLYFSALLFLLVGFCTRTAAIATWGLHWTLINTGDCSPYGADMYAHIFLFYLMVAPAAGAYSLDRALGRVSGAPSAISRLCLRVVQLHLCLSYLAGAYEKAQGPQWWNGEIIWRALSLPRYGIFDSSWMAHWPVIPTVLGWGTLVIEGLFWLFIWPRRTRRLWICLAASLHIGIAIFLRLHVFGALMCVLVISMFAISPEPSLYAASRLLFPSLCPKPHPYR